MDTIRITNAIIESVSLSVADHGILSAWVGLKYGGGSGQGFGGYALYSPPTDDSCASEMKNYCGLWIWRCCEVVGVDSWESLKGKSVRAHISEGLVRGIGHYLDDKWFFPQQELKKLEER